MKHVPDWPEDYSRLWQQVIRQMNVPPRGERGSPQNFIRMRMMGKVRAEVNRRLMRRKKVRRERRHT